MKSKCPTLWSTLGLNSIASLICIAVYRYLAILVKQEQTFLALKSNLFSSTNWASLSRSGQWTWWSLEAGFGAFLWLCRRSWAGGSTFQSQMEWGLYMGRGVWCNMCVLILLFCSCVPGWKSVNGRGYNMFLLIFAFFIPLLIMILTSVSKYRYLNKVTKTEIKHP